MIAHLLFTNYDFGHSFEGQEMKLIALVVEKKLLYSQDFDFNSIGKSASESTSSSRLPHLCATYRYHYVLDTRTYAIISTLVESFNIAATIAREEGE